MQSRQVSQFVTTANGPGTELRSREGSSFPLHSLFALRAGKDCVDTPAAGERPRLLLVERDESMRDMLVTMLSTHYRVGTATDGHEACQAARIQAPDLVLIDLCLPGTDNLTLIRAMRANDATVHLPIIVLTAGLHKDLLLRCLAAGASNFLLKPFNRSELLMCARVELQLRGTRTSSRH